MKTNEALVTLTDQVYVPTFVKAAADLGVDLSNPDDLSRALDIAAALTTIKQESSTSVVKSAHDTLMKAMAGPAAPVEKPAPKISKQVKEALAALNAARK